MIKKKAKMFHFQYYLFFVVKQKRVIPLGRVILLLSDVHTNLKLVHFHNFDTQ
jgi:hypothetical protein